MVIVQLLGRLGNQMFQYAAGRRLALQHKTELKFDLGAIQRFRLPPYQLSCFRIQEAFATAEEARRLGGFRHNKLSRIWLKLRRSLDPSCHPSYIREKEWWKFQPAVLEAGDNTYLEGFWQSEKYFADAQEAIRADFTYKAPLDGLNLAVATQIGAVEAVSVHIRRGDYATHPGIASLHGVLSLDYYERCVKFIAESVKQPHFFVFSDDSQWARDHLKLSFPTVFVTHNGPDNSYDDLRLMSLCRHNIIANSSFSWWGAWLNRNRGKLVCAPAQWYADPAIAAQFDLAQTWLRF